MNHPTHPNHPAAANHPNHPAEAPASTYSYKRIPPATTDQYRSWLDRQARAFEKEAAILDFLSTEIVSNVDVLSEHLRLSLRTTNTTLSRLEALGMIRRERLSYERSPVYILGITSRGQNRIAELKDRKPRGRTFLPRYVGLSSLPHRFDLQRLRVALTAAGATDWMPGVVFRTPSKGEIVPDAVCKRGGFRLAIELERTLKTQARYEEIFAKHFRLVEGKNWDQIVYVCLTEADAQRMRGMPRKIGSLMLDEGKDKPKREVERERWERLFSFVSRDQAPEFFRDPANFF